MNGDEQVKTWNNEGSGGGGGGGKEWWEIRSGGGGIGSGRGRWDQTGTKKWDDGLPYVMILTNFHMRR